MKLEAKISGFQQTPKKLEEERKDSVFGGFDFLGSRTERVHLPGYICITLIQGRGIRLSQALP